MSADNKRILIIGQGLAGSVLAFILIDSGCDVTVCDPRLPNTSSRIAAGVIKPVTGQRIVKSWKAEVLIPEAVSVYQKIQQVTGKDFFAEKPMFQVYMSHGQKNDWTGRLSQPEIAAFCDEQRPSSVSTDIWHIPFGGLFLRSCYHLRIPELIDACAEYIFDHGRSINEPADIGSLEISNDKVLYRKEVYDHVVICTGIDGGSINPLYDHVPLSPVKGEIILVGMKHLLEDTMISGGVYVVPVNETQALVGATYQWDNMDETPTAAGLEQLRSKLKKLLRTSFTIDAHYAAVRPASPDRKPIAGFLDDSKRILIMNGFGSKGVMFAPYMAKQVKNAILTGHYADEETDVRRFLS